MVFLKVLILAELTVYFPVVSEEGFPAEVNIKILNTGFEDWQNLISWKRGTHNFPNSVTLFNLASYSTKS